jgi:hypothetical protein
MTATSFLKSSSLTGMGIFSAMGAFWAGCMLYIYIYIYIRVCVCVCICVSVSVASKRSGAVYVWLGRTKHRAEPPNCIRY